MSNLVMWNMIVGFLLPNLIAVIQRPSWNSKLRVWVMIGICILGGLGTSYFHNDFRGSDIIGSILVVGVATITFYKGIWKPSGVAGKIESVTTPTRSE